MCNTFTWHRRFGGGIPTPQMGSFQNGAKFSGKTPLTNVEHEFLLYDDI